MCKKDFDYAISKGYIKSPFNIHQTKNGKLYLLAENNDYIFLDREDINNLGLNIPEMKSINHSLYERAYSK